MELASSRRRPRLSTSPLNSGLEKGLPWSRLPRIPMKSPKLHNGAKPKPKKPSEPEPKPVYMRSTSAPSPTSFATPLGTPSRPSCAPSPSAETPTLSTKSSRPTLSWRSPSSSSAGPRGSPTSSTTASPTPPCPTSSATPAASPPCATTRRNAREGDRDGHGHVHIGHALASKGRGSRRVSEDVGEDAESQVLLDSRVLHANFKHDYFTYTTMLDIFGEASYIASMRHLLDEMLEKGIEMDVATYTSAMHWLAKDGDLEGAMMAWREMRSCKCYPIVVSYTVIMKVLLDHGRLKEAA